MTQEEIKLVEAAMTNDEEAFERLFSHYYSMAYAMAMNDTKNDADAKDAVQEAFISIHKSINELRDPKAFPAWLKTIVHSKCYKLFRKKHDIPSDPELMNQAYCVEQRSYMIPFEHYNNENEKAVIHHLIKQLKPRYQEVVELVYIRQLKIEEAAQVLDLSAGTVKTRLHRAKKDLSALVKQFEKENNRKIKFRADMLAADSVVLIVMNQIKNAMVSTKEYVAGNLLTSACMASMSVLLVSGAVFVYDDIQKAQDNSEVTAQDDTKENEAVESTVDLNHSVFKAKVYQDVNITNSRSAYFTCVNFIMNDKENKQSEEAWQEILPIYYALKEKNDDYYKLLKNEGFADIFEQAY